MHNWLFCFQKSVALVLTHLLTNAESVGKGSKLFKSIESIDGDNNIWLSELGHGHGLQKAALLKRYTFQEQQQQQATRAFTTEDVFDAMRDKTRGGSSVDLSRINSTSSISSHSKERLQNSTAAGAGFPPSGLIPIASLPEMDGGASSYYEDKLATSYKDSDTFQKLGDIIGRLSVSQESEKSVDSHEVRDELRATSKESEDYLMFELDEGLDDRQNSAPTTAAHRIPSRAGSLALPSNGDKAPLMWLSGCCSKIGPRETNEDRLVNVPDLTSLLTELGPNDHIDTNLLVGDKGADRLGGGAVDSSAYFAVYDGHGGNQAAIYLQSNLMQKICR